MKQSIKSVVVLLVICLVVTALLAGVNTLTAPIIEQNRQNAATGSLSEVLPESGAFDEVALPDGAPVSVKKLYRETAGRGYAVLLEAVSSYSASPMAFTVGFSADGVITGVVITNYQEAKDFGKDYPASYVGKDSALSGVDLVAGVTYSSTAFKTAVQDAFALLVAEGYFAAGQKSEEQLIAELLPKALVGSTDSLGNAKYTVGTAPDGIETVYASKNGSGFACVVRVDGTAYVCGVGAFGGVTVFDLEGNDVTADRADAVATVKAAFTPSSQGTDAAHIAMIERAVEGAAVTALLPESVHSTVVGAYTLKVGGATQYAIVAAPLGYADTPVRVLYVLDEAGAVVKFSVISKLIVYDEYYEDYTLDETAYAEGMVGVTGDTLTADTTLIAGATVTSDAVQRAMRDIFAAFETVKEAAQ